MMDTIGFFVSVTLIMPGVVVVLLTLKAIIGPKREEIQFSEYKGKEERAVEMVELRKSDGSDGGTTAVVKNKPTPVSDFSVFFFLANLLIALVVILVAASSGLNLAMKTETYDIFHDELYSKWALHDTSAPVLVGEFGSSTDGYGVGEKDFWRCMTRFLQQYDLSYAYWPWNGERWYNDTLTFENEGYGLVEQDWVTIRHPKVIEDLVALD